MDYGAALLVGCDGAVRFSLVRGIVGAAAGRPVWLGCLRVVERGCLVKGGTRGLDCFEVSVWVAFYFLFGVCASSGHGGGLMSYFVVFSFCEAEIGMLMLNAS